MKRLLVALLLVLTIVGAAAQSKKKKSKPKAATSQSGTKGAFSYYLLSLSYSPNFCAQPGTHDPDECGSGKQIGFVVHGLWPQADTGRGPENCGTSAVPPDVVKDALKYIPTEKLIAHEWQAHGTCSGLSAMDYFAALAKARDSVNIPGYLRQPSRRLDTETAEVTRSFAVANMAFPPEAFHVSCYMTRQLQEVRVCFDKSLKPIACPVSGGECKESSVIVLPIPPRR